MEPVDRIAILALAGGVIGCAVPRGTGWIDSGIGVMVGILIGALMFVRPEPKGFSPPSRTTPG